MDEYCSMKVKACPRIFSVFTSRNFFIWDFGRTDGDIPTGCGAEILRGASRRERSFTGGRNTKRCRG